MSVTLLNTYEIGVNQDLSNALAMIDVNRIARDLTMLELDTVPKVSVGSLIESQGSVYIVSGSAFTPTGSAVAGAYLFFDDTVPGFLWSAVAGTYDPTRGGIYNGSDQRQCRFILRSGTEWDMLVSPEAVRLNSQGAFIANQGAGDFLGMREFAFHTDGAFNQTSAQVIAEIDAEYNAHTGLGDLPRDRVFQCAAVLQRTDFTPDKFFYLTHFQIRTGQSPDPRVEGWYPFDAESGDPGQFVMNTNFGNITTIAGASQSLDIWW